MTKTYIITPKPTHLQTKRCSSQLNYLPVEQLLRSWSPAGGWLVHCQSCSSDLGSLHCCIWACVGMPKLMELNGCREMIGPSMNQGLVIERCIVSLWTWGPGEFISEDLESWRIYLWGPGVLENLSLRTWGPGEFISEDLGLWRLNLHEPWVVETLSLWTWGCRKLISMDLEGGTMTK